MSIIKKIEDRITYPIDLDNELKDTTINISIYFFSIRIFTYNYTNKNDMSKLDKNKPSIRGFNHG